MAKKFVLITLTVTYILLQTTHAASFDCAAEPAVCKTKFATQFENGFKDLHLDAIRRILTTFIEIGNIIISDFPADSPSTTYLSERISITTKALEKINENVSDTKKLIAAIEEGMKTLEIDFKNIPDVNEKSITKKHDLPDSPMVVLRKLRVDTGDLWAEMYKGLRETDLKTFPEYAEVNVYMKYFTSIDGREAKNLDLMQAIEILSTKFNSSYFAEMLRFEKPTIVP